MNEPRKSPPPGRYIAEELPALQLDSVTLAERLDFGRSPLINGSSNLTPALAVNLVETLGSTAEMWTGYNMRIRPVTVNKTIGIDKLDAAYSPICDDDTR